MFLSGTRGNGKCLVTLCLIFITQLRVCTLKFLQTVGNLYQCVIHHFSCDRTFCNAMDCNPQGASVHGDSPGKITGIGCHFLLQGIFPTQGSNPALLHCRQITIPTESSGKPVICIRDNIKISKLFWWTKSSLVSSFWVWSSHVCIKSKNFQLMYTGNRKSSCVEICKNL